MSTYAVTFRIANRTVGGKTYNERYQAFMNRVYSDNGYWAETTSFILTTSRQSTSAFAKHISAELSKADDLVVVFDPSDMSCAYFGALEHKDALASFFNTCWKV